MKIITLPLFLTFAFLLGTCSFVHAQANTPEGKTLSIDLFQQNSGFYQSAVLEVPFKKIEPFLAYALTWKNNATIQDISLSIRFSKNAQTWNDWEVVKKGLHTNTKLELNIGELMYTNKSSQYFQIKLAQTNPLSKLYIRFYHPGKTIAIQTSDSEEMPTNSSSCPCPLPEWQAREMWCATGNCPPNPEPTETTASHLIIHHSAGTNLSNDWAAVVRAIWDFHVNTNNWSDIGYNYLVDPNGIIYEGRGDDILGAHFCGTNSKTMGTCVMGDFTNISPTEAAKMGLIQLLSWKACDRNINPFDTLFHGSSDLQLPRIAGHRDGCATACPGNSFYPLLPEIRQGIADFIENDCEFLDTKVEAFFNEETVHIFPNPASEQLYIRVENDWIGTLNIEMSTIDGKLVEQQILNKKTTNLSISLNIKNYPSGVYIFKIKTAEGQKNWKIVKE